MSCGTIRANRLRGCPLQTKKELKKSGRGSVDFRSDADSGIIVAKWLDNKLNQWEQSRGGAKRVKKGRKFNAPR